MNDKEKNMKKVLSLLLACCFFPALVFAGDLENRQLAKINAKKALKFPQECNIEPSVISAAKKVYQNNPNTFEAVYNYAVALSAGDCDDVVPAYIPQDQLRLAKQMFKKALQLKPTSPSCYAGLGFLTMLESGLSEAIFVGDNAMDDGMFARTVRANQSAAQKALDYYKNALKYGYTGSILPGIKEEVRLLEKELNKIKANNTKNQVRKQASKSRK